MPRQLSPFAVLVVAAAIAPERVNRIVDRTSGNHNAAVNSVLRYSVEILPSGATARSNGMRESFVDAEVAPSISGAARTVARIDVAAAKRVDLDQAPDARKCGCLNHIEAGKCHKGFELNFHNAYLEGSLCITATGLNNSWCYTNLECVGAPGLALSSQKGCKYRDADAAICRGLDKCECLPVEDSKKCHPDFADNFHNAMVENNSACAEDKERGAFCYTSMSCQAASDSSLGKCKYMYVPEKQKDQKCSIQPDVPTIYTLAPTIAPTDVPTVAASVRTKSADENAAPEVKRISSLAVASMALEMLLVNF